MKRLLLLLGSLGLLFSSTGLQAQYKTRIAFLTDKAYGNYVKKNLEKGMRVEANQSYYEIDKGDKGTYFGTNNGNPPCLVQWDKYIGKSPSLMSGYPEDKKAYAYWVEWHMMNILGSTGSGPAATVSINRKFTAQNEQSYSFYISYGTDLSGSRLVLNGTDYDYDNDGDHTDFTISLNGKDLIYVKSLNSLGMPGNRYGDITLDIADAVKTGTNTLTIQNTETSDQTDYAYLTTAKIYTSGSAVSKVSSRTGSSEPSISISTRFSAQKEKNYSLYVPASMELSNAKLALKGADYDYDKDGDYTDFTVELNGTQLCSQTPLHEKGMPNTSNYDDAVFDVSGILKHGENTLYLQNTENSQQTDYIYLVSARVYSSSQTSKPVATTTTSAGGTFEHIIYDRTINKKFTASTEEVYSFSYYNRSSVEKAYLLINGTDYDYDKDGDYTDFTISVNGNDVIDIQQLQSEGMGADGSYGVIAYEISEYLTSGSNSIYIKETEDASQVDYAYLKSAWVIAESNQKVSTGKVHKRISKPDMQQAPKNRLISEVVLTDKYTLVTVANNGSANLCANPQLYLKTGNSSKHYKIKAVEKIPFCRGTNYHSTDAYTMYFEGIPPSTKEINIVAPGVLGPLNSFYEVDISSSGTGAVAEVKKTSGEEKSFTPSMPPILRIEDITFSESVLNAREHAELSVTLKNVGPGDARDVYLSISGYQQGLEYPSKVIFPAIQANGGTKTATAKVKGGIDLASGVTTLTLEVVEPHFKVKIKGKQLKFTTKKLRSPELILARNAVVEHQSANPNNQIDINEMIELKFVVQNVGQGTAEDVGVSIDNQQKGVMLLGAVHGNKLKREEPNFSAIQSGKYRTVVYRYFVNSEFTGSQLRFTINAEESIGKYGFSETRSYPINTELEAEGFIRKVASQEASETQQEVVVEDLPDLVVDVDTDIPSTDANQASTYALIIGNEDYTSRQKGLTEEQNVDFAINDAQVFAQYCNRTLGIPQKQIKLLKNATAAEMQRGLSWISNLAKIEEGNARLIFYFSGHGLPDEKTKEPYIIPVDVSGKTIEYAVKLEEVYDKLTAHPTRQTTVFLDACFSGGGREQGLLAVKGVRIKPKSARIEDRLVTFSSSTGDESSAVYRKKHHGYFTYFLLKKLKETKGATSYKALSNYIIKNVRKETSLESKIQTPQVKVSPEVKEEWKNWTLR